jgi:NADH-quinone oxidoreductase subunit J
MQEYAERGRHPGPLPSPGVFARHNAVDTPALLPDGSTARASLSRVLVARGTVKQAPEIAGDVAALTNDPADDPSRKSGSEKGGEA